MTEDPRDVALSAAASGARVLVILTDGERLDGHIQALRHGGFVIVARHENGRVERFVYYAHVDSMAEFVEDDDAEAPEDDLQALTRRLREQAEAESRKSLAERMLRNSQRAS